MNCVVKGSKIPKIVVSKLPQFVAVVHYVYPDKYYDCYVKSKDGHIVTGNEVALFKFVKKQLRSLYPKRTKYFLFTNSSRDKITSTINSGKACALTLAEAEKVHYHLTARGMNCTFPEIRREADRKLYDKIVRKISSKRIEVTSKDLVERIFGSNYTTGFDDFNTNSYIPEHDGIPLEKTVDQFLHEILDTVIDNKEKEEGAIEMRILEKLRCLKKINEYGKRDRDFDDYKTENKRPRY